VSVRDDHFFCSTNSVCRHGGFNITMTKLLPVIMYPSSLSITYMEMKLLENECFKANKEYHTDL
jgi:hypothetical protein